MLTDDVTRFILSMIVIFFAIGLHEYAHCKMADLAGDPTPRRYGRVTLNLIKHFEPLGAIMIVLTSLTGFGIGWGRPAPMNPSLMKNPRWDHFAAVLAGPVSNIAQAAIYGILFRLSFAFFPNELLVTFAFLGTIINLGLAFFNMLPIFPLDGHWIVSSLLPPAQSVKWLQFSRTLGMFPLFALILLPVMTSNQIDPLSSFYDVLIIPIASLFLGL